MTDTTYTASETAAQLAQIRQQSDEYNHIEGLDDSITAYVNRVVEEGTFTPDATLTADIEVTLWWVFNRTATEDVTALVALGMMLGSALERDIPQGTDREAAWRDGKFELGVDDD